MNQAVLDLRTKVSDIMRSHGVVKAAVFGSFARGEEGPESDVDSLLELETGRTLLDLSGLRLVTPHAGHGARRARRVR